jgi:L-seryl-tRNA(Ser) seleniumtransferase
VRDYEQAIDDQTGLLLKVHTSNFSVIGFTKSLSLEELVGLGKKHELPVMEDLGSGTFIDFSKYGLVKEPTVQESVAAGIDVVTFSGDKLLGGPQAGIIVGSKKILDKIKQNPITRALRIDKLTLAALESTLRLYRDEKRAVAEIPTLKMLLATRERLEEKARELKARLQSLGRSRLKVETAADVSRAGGGSMPLASLPTTSLLVEVEGLSPNALERRLRAGRPPVVGRIENGRYVMDVRTVAQHEFEVIIRAFDKILERI